MIVAHLIGGNEIKGYVCGDVIINGEKLTASYRDLRTVCGNISLGELDTSSRSFQNDYIELVQDFIEDEDAREFVIDNHLTKEVSYSTYEIDFANRTLILKIDTYE